MYCTQYIHTYFFSDTCFFLAFKKSKIITNVTHYQALKSPYVFKVYLSASSFLNVKTETKTNRLEFKPNKMRLYVNLNMSLS